MRPGSVINYVVLHIDGGFTPETLVLGVDGSTRRVWDDPALRFQSIVALEVPHIKPTIAMVQFITGTPTPTINDVNMSAALIEGMWWKPGDPNSYIGEDANQVPPLPKLLYDCAPRAPFSGMSRCVNYSPVTGERFEQDLPWMFSHIHGPTAAGVVPWGPTFPDTVRTGLLENPPTGNKAAYNYVFAKGLGMVDFWRCEVRPDSTCAPGFEMYAIGWEQ
jgi:hypothetical protein